MPVLVVVAVPTVVLADLDAAESSDADGDAVAVGTGEVNSLRVAWVSALERRNANAMVKLFGPGGRLQGSLATEATDEGGAAAMVTGADGLVQYFKAFFKQYPLLKVEAGGLKLLGLGRASGASRVGRDASKASGPKMQRN